MTKRVLVIGGAGFYGRYLVADLLQHTRDNIVVAGRRPPATWNNERVTTAVCDLNDLNALKQLAASCDILVHCAGPFQNLPLNPLHAAIETGIHYVDIAEDRHFARRVQALAPQIQAAGITALSGISVCSAMKALFGQLSLAYLDSLHAIRTFAAPDTRKHLGEAMFHTMLLGVGQPFVQLRRGQPTQVHGWSEPEWVDFAPPIGRRLTYLVLEMADLDLLPALFGLQTVEFKAGTEHPLLNRLLALAATIRARTGRPQWHRLTPLVRALSWLAGRIGKAEVGVMFEITGRQKSAGLAEATYRFALVDDKDGGRIPSILAGIAVEELLNGRLTQPGLLPVHTWITPKRLLAAFTQRNLQLWWQPPGAPWIKDIHYPSPRGQQEKGMEGA